MRARESDSGFMDSIPARRERAYSTAEDVAMTPLSPHESRRNPAPGPTRARPRESNEGRTDPEWSIMGLLGTKEKGDYSGARGALYNLLQRHALSRDGTGYRRGSRTPRC